MTTTSITLDMIASRRPRGEVTICGQTVPVRLLSTAEIRRIREQIPDPVVPLPADPTKEDLKLYQQKLNSATHQAELRKCDALRLALEIAASINLEDMADLGGEAKKVSEGFTRWSAEAPAKWCRAFAERVSEILTSDEYVAVQKEQDRISKLDMDQAIRIGTEGTQGN